MVVTISETEDVRKIVICDIDGTISDARDRVEKYLQDGYVCTVCGNKPDQMSSFHGNTCAVQRDHFSMACRGEMKKAEKDWDSFYAKVQEDKPMENTVAILNALSETHRIVFATGRRESCRGESIKWIVDNTKLESVELYMRAGYDRSPSHKLKRNILKNLLTPEDVAFVLEDEVSTIEMYKKECPSATIINVNNYLWDDGS